MSDNRTETAPVLESEVAIHPQQPKDIRWCWYGDEDGGQVWTAASGAFYLEVNGATGRCEIAEWDDDSADIGRTLWEQTQAEASVDVLQRFVESTLISLRVNATVQHQPDTLEQPRFTPSELEYIDRLTSEETG